MFTVVFDLDDTLYDRTKPLKKAISKFGMKNADFNQFQRVFKLNSDIAFENVKNNIETLNESRITRVINTFQQLGMNIDERQAQKFQLIYEEYQQHIVLYPHIIDILEFLQKNNVQFLIITNGPENHQREKVKTLGLSGYFSTEQIIVSGEEGIAKPDKRIFLIAEKRFYIDKRNTWYVGDSYLHDIIGASNIGWHTIWFNPRQELVEGNLATKTVSSTLELQKYLVELFG